MFDTITNTLIIENKQRDTELQFLRIPSPSKDILVIRRYIDQVSRMFFVRIAVNDWFMLSASEWSDRR